MKHLIDSKAQKDGVQTVISAVLEQDTQAIFVVVKNSAQQFSCAWSGRLAELGQAAAILQAEFSHEWNTQGYDE